MRRCIALLVFMVGAFLVVPATAASAFSIDGPGPYRIINQKSGQCLNQDYSGGTAHPTVLAWPCTSTLALNEKWWLRPGPVSGYYQVENAASHQCLNQDFSGNVEHDNVIAYACSNEYYNGLWTRSPVGLDDRLLNGATRKCLNQNYSGGAPHHDILAYACVNATNNNWIFQKV